MTFDIYKHKTKNCKWCIVCNGSFTVIESLVKFSSSLSFGAKFGERSKEITAQKYDYQGRFESLSEIQDKFPEEFI